MEDRYTQRKKVRLLSPEREDVYAERDDDERDSHAHRSFAEIMNQQRLENERAEIQSKIKQSSRPGQRREEGKQNVHIEKHQQEKEEVTKTKTKASDTHSQISSGSTGLPKSDWERESNNVIHKRSRWDQTPQAEATPSRVQGAEGSTPQHYHAQETPTPSRRWAEKTPQMGGGATPSGYGGVTPSGVMQTPSTPSQYQQMAPEQIQLLRWERELEERNKQMTDDDLDVLIPGMKDGYEVL